MEEVFTKSNLNYHGLTADDFIRNVREADQTGNEERAKLLYLTLEIASLFEFDHIRTQLDIQNMINIAQMKLDDYVKIRKQIKEAEQKELEDTIYEEFRLRQKQDALEMKAKKLEKKKLILVKLSSLFRRNSKI